MFSAFAILKRCWSTSSNGTLESPDSTDAISLAGSNGGNDGNDAFPALPVPAIPGVSVESEVSWLVPSRAAVAAEAARNNGVALMPVMSSASRRRLGK